MDCGRHVRPAPSNCPDFQLKKERGCICSLRASPLSVSSHNYCYLSSHCLHRGIVVKHYVSPPSNINYYRLSGWEGHKGAKITPQALSLLVGSPHTGDAYKQKGIMAKKFLVVRWHDSSALCLCVTRVLPSLRQSGNCTENLGKMKSTPGCEQRDGPRVWLGRLCGSTQGVTDELGPFPCCLSQREYKWYPHPGLSEPAPDLLGSSYFIYPHNKANFVAALSQLDLPSKYQRHWTLGWVITSEMLMHLS